MSIASLLKNIIVDAENERFPEQPAALTDDRNLKKIVNAHQARIEQATTGKSPKLQVQTHKPSTAPSKQKGRAVEKEDLER